MSELADVSMKDDEMGKVNEKQMLWYHWLNVTSQLVVKIKYNLDKPKQGGYT